MTYIDIYIHITLIKWQEHGYSNVFYLPVIFSSSEQIEGISPNLTLYTNTDQLFTHITHIQWTTQKMSFFIINITQIYTNPKYWMWVMWWSPETLWRLESVSPLLLFDGFGELLSTPPNRGRRWLTDTCSMNDVPYFLKYHHSKICKTHIHTHTTLS